jgi:phosphoglycerate dehydrogenase-like enzyme
MPRAVLDMADLRPVWAMPDWVPARLREILPTDWEFFVSSEVRDGSGDGVPRAGPEVLDAVRGADVYLGWGIPEAIVEAGTGLEWVHSAVAGVGGSLSPTMLASPVVFTNSAGIHAAPIAETVLGMILHFGRGLDFALEGQRRGEWWQDPFYEQDAPLFELSEATVGIVGYGGIGREIARRVVALGADVVALRRGPVGGTERLEPVGGGDPLPSVVEVLHGRSGLERLMSESDVVVVAAPETPETRGMVDAAALGRMRAGAILVNVARGSLVEEEALLEALASGRLRGAGLDVFWEEPLPEGHPLWAMPNVILTPHVSPVTHGFWRRETDLVVRNLERYLAGEPLDRWENVVDKAAGY